MCLTRQFSTARGKASVDGTRDISKDLHETSQDSRVSVCVWGGVCGCVHACVCFKSKEVRTVTKASCHCVVVVIDAAIRLSSHPSFCNKLANCTHFYANSTEQTSS